MRLFTTIFVAICFAVTGFYLWSMVRHQTQQIKTGYQNDTQRIALELDNKLAGIRNLLNDISNITWVKKLSTSSDIFLREFTALQRIECQTELSRYLAIDSSIMDIAVYVADREIVLCQKGWFRCKEYRSYLLDRCDIEPNDIFAAAAKKNEADAFLNLELNTQDGRNTIIIKSLVNVAAPPASLILILNRNTFNQSIEKLGGENVLGIEVMNSSGGILFHTAQKEVDGYQLTTPSKVLPVSYRVTYLEPSAVLSQYSFVNLVFCGILFIMLALALLAAFLLSLHNIRPLQKLMDSISGLMGESQSHPGETSEFEQIEASFARLYAQKQDLQENIRENYNLTRQYALMLVLSGDQKFWEWARHFETLGIPFTEDQSYSVWILTQRQDPPEQIDYVAVFLELPLELVSAEEIPVGPMQTVLILGQKAPSACAHYEQAAEQAKQLILERYGALVEFQIGKCCGPGILGISQSYHELTEVSNQKGKDPAYRKTGRELAQYIEENYCDPDMSLKDLSNRWNLSVPTVSRLCKEALGTSFIDYVTKLRLEKAKQLLQLGHSPAEVAEAVGYGSEYSFRRAFQRNENCRLQDWKPSSPSP